MRRWLSGVLGGQGRKAPQEDVDLVQDVRAACRDAASEALPGAAVDFTDPLLMELESLEGWGAAADMSDLIRTVRADPSRTAELTRMFVDAVIRSARPPEPSLESVVAVVRTGRWLAGLLAEARGAVIHRPLAGDLVEVLAQNFPDAFQYEIGDKLLALGSEEQLWARGRSNIEDQLGRLDTGTAEGGLLEYAAAPESGLATSLLLTEAFWSKPKAVLVADGSMLLAADPGNDDAVALLRRQQVRAREDERNLLSSTTLVTREGGRLTTL